MVPELEAQLRGILAEIVSSGAARKIVVAGPGTGKTTLFRRLLEARVGPRDGRLVLTFINNLRAELEEALGELARVYTFHGLPSAPPPPARPSADSARTSDTIHRFRP